MSTHKGQYVTHTKVKLDRWNDGHTPTCMFDIQQGKKLISLTCPLPGPPPTSLWKCLANKMFKDHVQRFSGINGVAFPLP